MVALEVFPVWVLGSPPPPPPPCLALPAWPSVPVTPLPVVRGTGPTPISFINTPLNDDDCMVGTHYSDVVNAPRHGGLDRRGHRLFFFFFEKKIISIPNMIVMGMGHITFLTTTDFNFFVFYSFMVIFKSGDIKYTGQIIYGHTRSHLVIYWQRDTYSTYIMQCTHYIRN